MRQYISLIIAGILFNVAFSAAAASNPQIASFVIETLPSTDVVRFAVSPAKDKYEYKVVCGNDSIRVRLPDVGMTTEDVIHLETPRGSTLRKVRIVPQNNNRSVLQLYTTDSALDACDRTSVMSLDGNLVVSVALSDSQKHRRTKMLNALKETREAIKNSADKVERLETIAASTTPLQQPEKKTAASDDTRSPVVATAAKDKSKSLKGSIFDKSSKKEPSLQTDEEVNSQTMKYAGGLLFAAMVGFVAWYMSKKRNRFRIDENNIDILSQKKVGTHQTLMVAHVNGSRFLLAVGDKTVSSLGLIPTDGQTEAESAPAASAFTNSMVHTDFQEVVQESLAKEPRISETPYSEIKDEEEVVKEPARAAEHTSSFGSDFQQAIEKIVRDRNKPSRTGKGRTNADAEVATKALSDVFAQTESASNVSGLISMARMRAALENQSTRTDNQYRA